MKTDLRPSTCLAPLPVVLVTCANGEESNVLTVAWAGTTNSDPPSVSIAVRYSRHSLPLIAESGEFTVNLVSRDLLRATDLCGVLSGRDCDKFARAGLTRGKGVAVHCPYIEESPVSLECKVTHRLDQGTHALFVGEIVNVIADETYAVGGKISLPEGMLVAYANGKYLATGETIGTYGFTAKEKK